MMKRFLMIAVVAASLASCKKNVSEPGGENEHEAINSVTLTFSQNGTVAGTFIAEDPDGDGGAPPTRIDTIRLRNNQNYTAELTLKNISGTRVTDVTATVRQQGVNHEIFYVMSGASAAVVKTDMDANNLPIGFNSTWTTGAASSGSVLIKLMHKPFIKKAGDNPNIGHSDLALAMPIIIQ